MKSYSRLSKSNPDETINFKFKKPLNKSGAVHEIKETSSQHMQVVLHPKPHARVAKSLTFADKFDTHDKFIEAVNSEYQYAHLAHLHAKPPVEVSDDEYLLIMKREPGYTLHQIIHLINQGKIQLTDKQYVSLMIETVRAVQADVDDCKILHRNIKDDNFMVDIRTLDEPKVKVLGYGYALSKEKATEDKHIVGAKLFMAPEVYFQHTRCTEQSDIFSLGMVYLKLVSKNFDTDLALDNKGNIEGSFRKKSLLKGISNGFIIRDELSKIAPKLKSLISIICNSDPIARKNLNAIEETLHSIRLELDYPHAKPKEIARLQAIQRVAIDIRHSLKQSVRLKTANKRICEGLAHIPDVQSDVKEFLTTLGIKALFGCITHFDVRQKLNDIAKEYTRNCDNFAKVISSLGNSKESNPDSERYLSVLKHKQEKYTKAEYTSYEGFIKASKKIDQLVDYAPFAFKKYFVKAEESVLDKELQWKEKELADARNFFISRLKQLNDLRETLEGLYEINKKKTHKLNRSGGFSEALGEINNQYVKFNSTDVTKFYTSEKFYEASQKISELLLLMRGTMRALMTNQSVHRPGFFSSALLPASVQRMLEPHVEDNAPAEGLRV